MIPVTGLNHAVLFVRELQPSVHFYRSVFGFEVVTQMQDRMAFLRAAGSSNHHDLGLFALGAEAPLPIRGAIGLYHLAWEVAHIEDLAVALPVLQQTGYYTGASDHGASKSVYGRDPDGHEFEIVWRVPREQWGEFEHHTVTRSLNLSHELARFGGSAKSQR